MDKERSRQINVYQLHMKFLRKELILQVEPFTDITQQVVEYEIIMTGCQHHIIKQIGHCNKVTDSQYKPHPENPKQYPAQFIQMIPES